MKKAEEHESMGMKKEMAHKKEGRKHESIGMKKKEHKEHEKSRGMSKKY
jgi:hypothetical protein